ncbi:hypothetical protein ACVWZZ_004309 [Bradyrhizobium sp. LM6.10]
MALTERVSAGATATAPPHGLRRRQTRSDFLQASQKLACLVSVADERAEGRCADESPHTGRRGILLAGCPPLSCPLLAYPGRTGRRGRGKTTSALSRAHERVPVHCSGEANLSLPPPHSAPSLRSADSRCARRWHASLDATYGHSIHGIREEVAVSRTAKVAGFPVTGGLRSTCGSLTEILWLTADKRLP